MENDDNTLGAQIYRLLDFYPQSVETIIDKLHKECGIEIKYEELTGELMMLCLLGQIKQDSPSWFSKNKL